MFRGIYTLVLLQYYTYLVIDRTDVVGGDPLPELAEPPLKIASFNIKQFGQTKYKLTEVVDIIVKILSRYDIIQILEITDKQQTAFESLRHDLNTYETSHGGGAEYKSAISDRLGRSAIKEQYGFLYKTSRVILLDAFQFNDTEDIFEREPFGVRFSSPSSVIEDFGMVATRIKPKMALEELDNLTMVYETFKSHWGLSNIIISGDFNAGCTYLRLGDWKSISLRTDSRFSWLLDDYSDTTVSGSSCSYDRFVIAGDQLYDAIVPKSVQIYRFDERMGLNKTMGQHVSDRYPIELEIAGKPNITVQKNTQTSASFTVRDTKPVSIINSIQEIYSPASCAGSSFSVKHLHDDGGSGYVTAHVTNVDTYHVMSSLKYFQSSCAGTLSAGLVSMVEAYIKSSHLRHDGLSNIYGLVSNVKKTIYETEITCLVESQSTCHVTVSRIVSSS